MPLAVDLIGGIVPRKDLVEGVDDDVYLVARRAEFQNVTGLVLDGD